MAVRADTDDFIAFLNGILQIDPLWTETLLQQRVTCNVALANHPSVQVGQAFGDQMAGVLGLLNGYFGTIEAGPKVGWGPITAIYDGGRLVRFERTDAE